MTTSQITITKKTSRERALAAYLHSLAQQQRVGMLLDDLPSWTCEERLKEHDDIMVRNGSRTLAVYQVRPDGLHRLKHWPKELDLRP
jgi:hypothetical protein